MSAPAPQRNRWNCLDGSARARGQVALTPEDFADCVWFVTDGDRRRKRKRRQHVTPTPTRLVGGCLLYRIA